MTPSCPQRPLDTVERFWYVRGLEGGAICVGVLLLRGTVSREAVERAARGLMNRHPVLGARIAGDDEPRFEPGSFELPFRIVPAVEHPWTEIVEQEVGRGFDASHGPLWRITFVSGAEPAVPHAVVLAAHHSILDGHSQLRLLEDFLRLVQRPDEMVSPSGPPLDELLELTPRRAPAPPFRRERIFPIEGRAAAEERATRFLIRDLGPELVTRLIERVKRERTTLPAALSVAATVGAHRLVGPKTGFQLVVPLSLRSLCRPPVKPEVIGLYASGLLLTLDLHDGKDFWARVRAHHKESLSAIGAQHWRQDPVVGPEALRAVRERVAGGARDEERQGRLADLVVSFGGDFDPGLGNGEIEPIGYYELASQHRSGHHFGLWPHGLGGKICLTVGYVSPVTSRETAERFSSAIEESLVEACVT